MKVVIIILSKATSFRLFPAPSGSPRAFTVTPGVRNLTFSWSPPAPTLRNGVITGYSLSCVPEIGGGTTISMQYTAAGTFTLGGFTPFTSYNCSISASNSQGSGPLSSMISPTLEARKQQSPVIKTKCTIVVNPVQSLCIIPPP